MNNEIFKKEDRKYMFQWKKNENLLITMRFYERIYHSILTARLIPLDKTYLFRSQKSFNRYEENLNIKTILEISEQTRTPKN